MAKFRCPACGQEGSCVYEDGRHACPVCGSRDVQIALAVEELADSLIEAIRELAERDDEIDAAPFDDESED